MALMPPPHPLLQGAMKPLANWITGGFSLPRGPTCSPQPSQTLCREWDEMVREVEEGGRRGRKRREVQSQQIAEVSAVVVSIFTPFMFFQFRNST